MTATSLKAIGRYTRQGRSRAVVKTAVYRVLMVAVTVVIALAVTGSVGDALNIGIAANVVKTGTYYAYERCWDRVRWGLVSTAPGYSR